MERLWAGDYSQLPAGQQLHALNLSAQQQQAAWLGQHQGNKVNYLFRAPSSDCKLLELFN